MTKPKTFPIDSTARERWHTWLRSQPALRDVISDYQSRQWHDTKRIAYSLGADDMQYLARWIANIIGELPSRQWTDSGVTWTSNGSTFRATLPM